MLRVTERLAERDPYAAEIGPFFFILCNRRHRVARVSKFILRVEAPPRISFRRSVFVTPKSPPSSPLLETSARRRAARNTFFFNRGGFGGTERALCP